MLSWSSAYEAFEIRIIPAADDGDQTRVRSPAGEGSSRFELPCELVDRLLPHPDNGEPRRDLVWVEDIEERESSTPEQIGDALFRAVFTPPIRALLDASRRRLSKRRGRGLCIRFHFDLTDPRQAQLSRLPWELVFDADRRHFLNLSETTPVVRYLELPGRVPRYELPRRLRILLVASQPLDLEPLRLERELAQIKNSWEQDNVEVHVVAAEGDRALGSVLRDALRTGEYHVLHFMGHGRFDPATAEGALVFETTDRRSQCVAAEAFASWLVNCRSLRLIVLNACSTGRSGARDAANPFAGVAAALVRAGIPGVLAMQDPMPDQLAIEFSRVLYQGLAHGKPVEAALADARLELHALRPESAIWGSPVLFARTRDIVRTPPKIGPTLTRMWTLVGSILFCFSVVIFLRTRSVSLLPGVDLREFVDGDVAAHYGILVGIPLFFLLLYLTYQYQKDVREKGLVQRLPVAFNVWIQGRRFVETLYQYTFFFLFLALPMIIQGYLYVEMMKGTVWVRKPPAPFASGWEHFTKYVPPTVIFTDDYRYGSMDTRPGVVKKYNNVTFYPFWEPWFFLIAELLLLETLLAVSWKLVKRRE